LLLEGRGETVELGADGGIGGRLRDVRKLESSDNCSSMTGWERQGGGGEGKWKGKGKGKGEGGWLLS
jgi:hypothetical protein